MLRTLVKTMTVVLASSALLSACGGGGGNDNPNAADNSTGNTASNSTATPAVALPTTVISGVFDDKRNSSQPLTILLQNDGSYFVVYSDATSGANAAGAVVGTGTLNNGSFSSSNGLDLSLIGVGNQTQNPVTLSASYAEKSALNGSITYATGNKTTSFAGVYNSSYETLPDLTSLAGVYKGSIATKEVREDNIVLTISSDGKLTGQLSCGCKINANLVPRPDHTAYDATLAFNDGDNPLTGKSFAGNVYLDVATKRLYIVGKMTDTQSGAVFVGTKS